LGASPIPTLCGGKINIACAYFFSGVRNSSASLLLVDNETLDEVVSGLNEVTQEKLEVVVTPEY